MTHVVDALDLLPEQLAAMVAAGATAEVVKAACSVICRAARALIGPAESVEFRRISTDSTELESALKARREADRLRQERRRASRDKPVSRDAPLSLKEVDLFSREREEGKGCGEGKPETPTPETRSQLSPDWKPDDKTWRLALTELAEAGALRCLANFRDHWVASGKSMTAAQWQAKFRVWVRNEHVRPGAAQCELPLMRSIEGGARPGIPGNSPTIPGKVFLRPQTHAAQWRAWERHRGSTLPLDKRGGWWVDGEWPPATEPRRECG